jgi:hypothetical protein
MLTQVKILQINYNLEFEFDIFEEAKKIDKQIENLGIENVVLSPE